MRRILAAASRGSVKMMECDDTKAITARSRKWRIMTTSNSLQNSLRRCLWRHQSRQRLNLCYVASRGQRGSCLVVRPLTRSTGLLFRRSDERVIDIPRLNYVATTSLRIYRRHQWRTVTSIWRPDRASPRPGYVNACRPRHRPSTTSSRGPSPPFARHQGVQIKWRPDVVAGLLAASSCIASVKDAYPGGRPVADPSLKSTGPSLIRSSLARPSALTPRHIAAAFEHRTVVTWVLPSCPRRPFLATTIARVEAWSRSCSSGSGRVHH